MSKFDLEAAKRGEAVQVSTIYSPISPIEWVDAYFVGTCKNGAVVFDIRNSIEVYQADSDKIRMKPKKHEMWIFPYSSDGVIYTSSPCGTRSEAEIVRLHFPKPAGEVQMILVDEE